MDEMRPRQEDEKAGEARIPEERYAYYRRCQVVRRNGQQCKAPAMKGQNICYKHEGQAAAERQRQALLQSLKLPPLRDFTSLLRAIQKVAQAVLEDRIDLKTAGGTLNRMQGASARLGRVAGRPPSFEGSGLPIILYPDEEL